MSNICIGKDIASIAQLQHTFTSFVIIVDVLIYATIIGSFGTALHSIDLLHAQKKRGIETTKMFGIINKTGNTS